MADEALTVNDVSPGMRVAAAMPRAHDPVRDAPSFCVPYMSESEMTCPTKEMKHLLWLLHCVQSVLLHPGTPAYTDGQGDGSLKCIIDPAKRQKTYVLDSLSDQIAKPIPELDVELRFMTARDPTILSDDTSRTMYLCLLVAHSPAAFSLTRALRYILSTSARASPSNADPDPLCRILNLEHNRLSPSFNESAASSNHAVIDWLAARTFSADFSIHSAMDYVQKTFFDRHSDSALCLVDGFPVMNRTPVLDNDIRGAYVAFDVCMEENIKKMYKKKSKKRKAPEDDEPEDAPCVPNPCPDEIPLPLDQLPFVEVSFGLSVARLGRTHRALGGEDRGAICSSLWTAI